MEASGLVPRAAARRWRGGWWGSPPARFVRYLAFEVLGLLPFAVYEPLRGVGIMGIIGGVWSAFTARRLGKRQGVVIGALGGLFVATLVNGDYALWRRAIPPLVYPAGAYLVGLYSERVRGRLAACADRIHDEALQEVIAAKMMLELGQTERAADLLTSASDELRALVVEIQKQSRETSELRL